ncbi:MAG: hypothetical protein ACLTSZ_13505 [Lachnospiraceae bacterium]
MTEKTHQNLIYAKKLAQLFTDAGYRVVLTRETEDGLYDADSSHTKAQDMQRRVAIIAGEERRPDHQHPPEQLSGSVCLRPLGSSFMSTPPLEKHSPSVFRTA